MNKALTVSNKTIYWTMALFAIAFLCFPSNNMSPDAIAYAADVKYGVEIFYPHHLLFNAMHWCIYQLSMIVCNANVVSVMHLTTAIISICTLYVTYKTLNLITDASIATALTILAGCCFGFLRYTFECEVYVTPILFSMASSYYLIRYLQDDRIWQIILTGIFASIAVLFHQIHLFWGIGLFVGLIIAKKYKGMAIYAICTLSVIAVYSIILVCYVGQEWSIENLFKYIASYYYSDNAVKSGIGVKLFLMAPISLFRTFMQVHGDILIQTKLQPALFAFFAIIPLLIFLFVRFIKETTLNNKPEVTVAWTHITIFTLQLLFAIYSDGNMEFMVMLPFALVIIVAATLKPSIKYVLALALSMFAWNFAFAVWPNFHYNQYKTEEFVDYIHSHPSESVVAYNACLVRSIYHLEYGECDLDRVVCLEKVVNEKVYITDLVDRPIPFSRQKFLEQTSGIFDIKDTVATIEADYGTYHLFKVVCK